MHFKLSNTWVDTDVEITHKRKMDYIFLLSSMMLSFVTITPLSILVEMEDVVRKTIIGITTIPWYIFCYRVTSNFYTSKLIRYIYAFLLLFQFLFNYYIIEQDATPILQLIIPASVGYLTSLLSFGLIFYVLLKDIFMRQHDLTYSLLGASNIYFLIPVIFSYIYSLAAIQDPTIINADPHTISEVLFNCWNYSWYVLAGMEDSYPDMVSKLQSLAILESIAANLFAVFIIGRLMIR